MTPPKRVRSRSSHRRAPQGVAAARGFEAACSAALGELHACVDRDWSAPAGTLEWTCAQTAEHTIDCLFSYALQLAARADGSFLPFEQLRALPEASPGELVAGLGAMGELFGSLLERVPSDATASDGIMTLTPGDWAARGAYEVLLHGQDILQGFGVTFDPPPAICAWVVASPKLWMLDRNEAARAEGDPWAALLFGSGRKPG